MRQRNLFGMVPLFGLALVVAASFGPAPGQSPPTSWAPTGEADAGPPSVIATTKPPQKAEGLPAEQRLPLPDDALPAVKPPPPPPAAAAAPPAAGALQQTNYSPPADAAPEPAVQRSGAVLGVEVQGPTAATPQQTFAFSLLVKNYGRDVLSQVRIELPVPGGSRVLACEPNAERPGDRLSWLIGNLEAGGERRLRVELLPSQAGDLHLCPHASYSAAVGLRTNVVRPPFALSVNAPETAAVGDRVVFAIQLGNHTPDPMRLVQVRCQLSAGLWHAQGELIEADLPGGLAAGEQKTIHLQAETRGTGRLQMQVTASSDGRHNASSQHFVAVNEPALAVQVEGPRRGTLGHELAYRIEVSNPGKVAAAGVKLRQALPQGLEFVTAGSQASHDTATQSVNWDLGELPGGQRRSVTFQVKSKQVGDWAMPVTLFADAMQEARSTHSVHVDAAPALALEATADDNPIDLGRETNYEVRVFNQGNGAASGVCLSLLLPEHLAVAAVDGPTPARDQGRLVVFEPLQLLRGRATAVYRLRLRGQKAGEGRVRVEVSAGGLAAPVQRELTARVRPLAPQ